MSEVNNDILIELKEKYEKLHNLLDEESKNDPDTEPYKSKYAAQEILNNMKSCLAHVKDSIPIRDPLYEQIDTMYGAVLLMLGTTAIDTEELATGVEHLMNCLNLLEDKALCPMNILIVLKALNHLGLLWSQRSDAHKSHGYLLQAEQLYSDYVDQCTDQPVDVHSLFTTPDTTETQTKSDSPLENVHTLTLYYLAQVYGMLGNPVKSAMYCHTTLKRQLETKNYDKIEWALNSATLSQFFMEKNAFCQARHHLAAASYMLSQYEEELETDDCSEEELEAKRERLRHRGADVARCWAKYGIVLLDMSRERLVHTIAAQPTDETPIRLVPPEELSGLQFSQLELSLYEDQVTGGYLMTYDDARAVFLNCQDWLNQAKMYYTLEDHASDYVRIIQDHSELYRNLIFFEDDEERHCKMHKRRVDLLEGVVKELNPTYYMTQCRELWFELAETYMAMMDLKMSILEESNEKPTAHAVQKINQLAEKAIPAFKQFLESLIDPRTHEVPEVFPPEMERPGLLIYFYLARLYGKLVPVNRAALVDNLAVSLQYYRKLVDYCHVNESGKESVAAELKISQDMLSLLPMRINKLVQSIDN